MPSTETVTPVMVVDRMLEILAKPEAWTQGCNAKNQLGYAVPADSAKATCFCLAGARWKALGELRFTGTELLYAAMLEQARPYGSTVGLNDSPSTKHADILRYLKAVRARLEATCLA